MMVRRSVLIVFGLFAAGAAATVLIRQGMPANTTPTGKVIRPATDSANQTGVGSFPVNMTVSPDGKYILVSDCGYREQVSVIDAASGKLVSSIQSNARRGRPREGLYFGIACHKGIDGATQVAVSRGSQDMVSFYKLGDDGNLSYEYDFLLPESNNALHLPHHVAGVAWSPDGTKVYVVCNQSHALNGFQGNVLTIGATTHSVLSDDKVGSFPLDVLATPDGVFVTDEGGREVSKLGGGTIRTGDGPTYLAMDHGGKHLFVSNSNSDTVSFIDPTHGRVVKTVLVRPAPLHGLPGATPLGMAVAPDDRTLYVAAGDLNAVAVIDIPSGGLKGYLPAGWYPTSVALSPDGRKLFVANAKGVQTANPNGKPVGKWGQYDENIIEGTVSVLDLPGLMPNLAAASSEVVRNNTSARWNEPAPVLPRIDHLIYIIKENRTYDQVLGDMPEGNGDPSLTIFGQDVTPNQHALARRFALFDNFYVCAEVSADGWNWSTSGMANAYTERNVPYNYSGRGRSYDFEGTNNSSPVSLEGRRDVAEAAGGYIWDAFIKKGLSVRDYGMFNSEGEDVKGPDGKPIAEDNRPTKPDLVDRTCVDFRDFDMSFADSEAWVKLGLKPFPRQTTVYGSHKDPSRVTTWLREFNQYVKDGDLPNLSLIRLPHNHTSGTSPGMASSRAMVADNDYGVGQIVEAVSHSPFWKSTAIFIVEDDAQAGFDHVDCHRSPVLVISPYIKQGTVDGSFYNTDSVLATMEGLQSVPPHNEYVATARLFHSFMSEPSNDAPYDAIMPSREILSEVNQEDAYRASDSQRMLSRYSEESEPDEELNEILWRSMRGRNAALPDTPGVRWGR